MTEKSPDLFSFHDPNFGGFIEFIRETIIAYDLDSIDEGQEVTHPDLQATFSCISLTKSVETDEIIETRIIRGESFAPVTLGKADDHFYELVTVRSAETKEIINRELYVFEVDPTNPSPSFQSH